MKKIFLLITFGICILIANVSANPVVDKSTFIYSIKGNDTLRLDKYEVPDLVQNKPCVIFVFGGGFVGGSRDNDSNASYMRRLAEMGYVSIAIDYRLGLTNVKGAEDMNPMEFINLFGNTIAMAVEDLFDATNFVLDNSVGWNIDREQVIANGSSAGAITILQAEYDICTDGALSKKLPDNFNYAGIIAFAGAIFSTDGDLKWQKKPAPIQMFHGNGDSNVPYDKIEMFNLGFYGSSHIAGQLQVMQSPYYFYDVNNGAHEVAHMPMQENLSEIDSFIRNYAVKKKPWMIHAKMEEIGRPEIRKNFELKDFIKANSL